MLRLVATPAAAPGAGVSGWASGPWRPPANHTQSVPDRALDPRRAPAPADVHLRALWLSKVSLGRTCAWHPLGHGCLLLTGPRQPLLPCTAHASPSVQRLSPWRENPAPRPIAGPDFLTWSRGEIEAAREGQGAGRLGQVGPHPRPLLAGALGQGQAGFGGGKAAQPTLCPDPSEKVPIPAFERQGWWAGSSGLGSSPTQVPGSQDRPQGRGDLGSPQTGGAWSCSLAVSHAAARTCDFHGSHTPQAISRKPPLWGTASVLSL